MIFWILTGIAAIAIILTFIWWIFEEGWAGVLYGFLISLMITLGWFLVAGLVLGGVQHAMGANKHEDTRHELQTLGSDSGTTGRFYFLGGGYIGSERVLSYIRVNDDGSFTPDQASGNASRVYEDNPDDPYMITYEWSADYWWIGPPMLGFSNTYEFHIPEGSVSNGYEVKP